MKGGREGGREGGGDGEGEGDGGEGEGGMREWDACMMSLDRGHNMHGLHRRDLLQLDWYCYYVLSSEGESESETKKRAERERGRARA